MPTEWVDVTALVIVPTLIIVVVASYEHLRHSSRARTNSTTWRNKK